MTVEMCLSFCREHGFSYSGLQWRIECYCGDVPVNGFKWAWSDKCREACAGNSFQVCGGSNAMSVYTPRGVQKVHMVVKFGRNTRSCFRFWLCEL